MEVYGLAKRSKFDLALMHETKLKVGMLAARFAIKRREQVR
jgi:hypothetical protein